MLAPKQKEKPGARSAAGMRVSNPHNQRYACVRAPLRVGARLRRGVGYDRRNHAATPKTLVWLCQYQLVACAWVAIRTRVCVPAHGWRLKTAELGTGPDGLPVNSNFCETCTRVSLVLCPAIQDLCG